jgi:hypothetical protein
VWVAQALSNTLQTTGRIGAASLFIISFQPSGVQKIQGMPDVVFLQLYVT